MPNSANLIPSTELRTELEQLATTVTRPKGSFLFKRGDEASGVFFIRRGKVSLGLDYENAIYPPRVLGPNAIVGLPAAVSGNPYSLTATVLEDSELAFVTRESLLSCLKHNVVLCFRVMDMLSGEISTTRSAFKKNPARRLAGAFKGSNRPITEELAEVKAN